MKFFALLFVLAAGTTFADSSPWQPFTALALSSDEAQLATGGLGGEVLWREAKTGEVLHRFVLPGELPVAGLAFNDGILGAVLTDGTTFSFQPADVAPQPVPASRWPQLTALASAWRDSGPPMSGVNLLREGRSARGRPDGTIAVRTSATTAPVAWQAHRAAVTGLTWAASGAVLYSCSFDGTLARWDAATGKLLARL